MEIVQITPQIPIIFNYLSESTISTLLRRYALTANIAVRLTDPQGNTICGPFNSTTLCEKFNCKRRSDLCTKCTAIVGPLLSASVPYLIYQCKGDGDIPGVSGCGLWEAVAKIEAGDNIIAYLVCGQVLYEGELSEERIDKFRTFALTKLKLSGDELDKYIEHVRNVPVMKEDDFSRIVSDFHWIANLFSDFAHNKKRLQHLESLLEIKGFSTRDIINSIMTTISQIIPEMVGACLWYFDGRGNQVLRAVSKFNIDDVNRRVLPIKESVSGRALESGQTLVVNPHDDKDFHDLDRLRKYPIGKMIAHPFYEKSEKKRGIGTLTIYLPPGYNYPLDDLLKLLSHSRVLLDAAKQLQRERYLQGIIRAATDLLESPKESFWQCFSEVMNLTLGKMASYSVFFTDRNRVSFNLASSKIGVADGKFFNENNYKAFTRYVFREISKNNMAEVFIHDLRRSNSEKGIWLSGIFRDKVLNVSDMQLCKQSWGVIGLPIKDHWGRVIGGIIGTTPASPIPQDSSSDLVQFRVFDEDDTKAAKGIASLLGMRFHRELVEEARALSHSMRSHELVAPIHAIKGYCDNLEYSYKNEIKANLDNDVITGIAFDKHLERLSELCDLLELIAVSGGSEDPRESRLVNFEKEILLPVIQPLRPYARKEKATSIEYSDDFQSLPKLYLAFDHMKRALFNVVMNAIKYSKMGQNAKIQILLNDDEDNYLIRIINQGIGIPEGEEDIIFQLFEKGSNADIIYESGSGLGLYITRKILKWHHGDIKLTDRHPENTTFTFIIPKRLELS